MGKEKPQSEKDRHIDVVLKALEVLEVFGTNKELTLKEITRLTDLTPNRATRILGTLESRGYILKIPEKRTYRLGYRIYALGKAFEAHDNLADISRPVLKQLVKVSGESASFFVISGNMRMVLAREEGTHAIRFAVSEGQMMPLHAGAGGKTLLAYSDAAFVDKIFARIDLAAFTKKTRTDKDQLRKELNQIRQKGYAVSKGERVQDSGAVAAPVFTHDEKLLGVLGIAGPSSRFQGEQLQTRLDLILDAALTLSNMLGWNFTNG